MRRDEQKKINWKLFATIGAVFVGYFLFVSNPNVKLFFIEKKIFFELLNEFVNILSVSL